MVLFFLFFLLTACGESEIEKVDSKTTDESTEENSNETTEKKEAPETQNLSIGDTVDFDGVKLTLNEARIEPGGEFDQPQNDQFIVVNLTAENTTEEEQVISSIINVELKDSEGYAYSTTFLTEGIKAQLDGSIEPGGTLRGEIPFDVPTSDTYELHFSNPFTSGKAIWKIPSDQLVQ